jgi:hypothetical protein
MVSRSPKPGHFANIRPDCGTLADSLSSTRGRHVVLEREAGDGQGEGENRASPTAREATKAPPGQNVDRQFDGEE